MRLMFVGLAALLAGLTGCSIAPTHPSLTTATANLAPLIPVRDFVADRQASGGHQVSPDGKKLAWMGANGIRPAVWVKTLGADDAKAFDIRARGFRWSADSKRLALLADSGGDEDTHIHAGAVDGPSTALVDLTPFERTASHILRVVRGGSDIVITTNRRDKKVFDLYRLDLGSGRLELLATNPGSVGWWGVDRLGRLRARVLLDGDSSLLQLPEAADPGGWRTTARWSRFDQVQPLDLPLDGDVGWALSNRGRDKLALVRFDLRNGAETVLHADPAVDLGHVLISQKSHAPLMIHSMPGYPRVEVLDPALRTRLQALATDPPADLYVTSADDDERTLTVAAVTDKGVRTFLFSGDSTEPRLLGQNSLARQAAGLSSTRPIEFSSRDGLVLHGYLTLPEGVKPAALPLVLLVHGGPWARDRWGDGNTKQFLANRGYAVLQVNYRGSTGYGRAFTDKAIGEFAGKMHDDLVDGVEWAVKAGVADQAKVAIHGASYGGYAALVGATSTPEVFACAVDIVGPSHLARLLETVPAYWELGLPWWRRFVGDPARPEDRKAMDARSPLFKAERATNPILIMHGVNDPRVKLEQSELMVAALRKAGKQVDFVTFKGDGHGNQKWSNNLTLLRKTEDFLAACLGGRSSGFDYYQLGAWAF